MKRIIIWILKALLTLAAAAVSLAVLLPLLLTVATGESGFGLPAASPNGKVYEAFAGVTELVGRQLSGAREEAYALPKVYWLSDDKVVAPEPNQALFGYTKDPKELEGFLSDAQKVLKGQKTLFTTETSLMPGTGVTHYLDDSIMAITWKSVINGRAVTISEVKISHPSQIRRYFTGDAYRSGILREPSTLSTQVNAVVGSAADFYYNRDPGLVVYHGTVWKENDAVVETCHIDDKGDMIFTYMNRFKSKQEAQQFVDENNIRFSVSFGPVLVENGQAVEIAQWYPVGEVNLRYSRAVLCQLDELHYVVATVNYEGPYSTVMNIYELQNMVKGWGVRHAYTLDGGQTGAIIMNDKLINRPDWGFQRHVSDIFYFATAIPDGGNKGE